MRKHRESEVISRKSIRFHNIVLIQNIVAYETMFCTDFSIGSSPSTLSAKQRKMVAEKPRCARQLGCHTQKLHAQ
jgi:hypothetical protein